MDELNYTELTNEIIQKLGTAGEIIFATCADNKVTARTMCHINDGLQILFGTNKTSEKTEQLLKNAHVAFAISNIQIEAVAEIAGHPDELPQFTDKYIKKFLHLGATYPNTPDSIVVIARPTKISLYKYLGKACTDVLDVENKKAYRIEL